MHTWEKVVGSATVLSSERPYYNGASLGVRLSQGVNIHIVDFTVDHSRNSFLKASLADVLHCSHDTFSITGERCVLSRETRIKISVANS